MCVCVCMSVFECFSMCELSVCIWQCKDRCNINACTWWKCVLTDKSSYTCSHTHTHWPPQYTQTRINRHPASHIHHTHTHHRHLHKQNCRPTTTYSDTPPSPTLSISPPYTHTQYQRPTTNINTIRLGLDDIMAWMTARLPALLVWL